MKRGGITLKCEITLSLNMEFDDKNCGSGLTLLAEPEFEYLHYRQETDVKKYTLRIGTVGKS